MASLNTLACLLKTQIPIFEKQADTSNEALQILNKKISKLLTEINTLETNQQETNQQVDLEKLVQAKKELPYIIMQIYRLFEKLLIRLSTKEWSNEKSYLLMEESCSLIDKTILALTNEIPKLQPPPSTPKPQLIKEGYLLTQKTILALTNEIPKLQPPPSTLKPQPIEEAYLLRQKTILAITNEPSPLQPPPSTLKPQPIKEVCLPKTILPPPKQEPSPLQPPPSTPKPQPIKEVCLPKTILPPPKQEPSTLEPPPSTLKPQPIKEVCLPKTILPPPKQEPSPLQPPPSNEPSPLQPPPSTVRLKGFENLGNACFMNTVKQVVFNNSLLCSVIKNELLKYYTSCEKEKLSVKIFLEELENYQNETVETIPFHDELRYFLHDTQAGKQEDAGEFLLTLLGKISPTAQPDLRLTKKTLTHWKVGEVLRELSQKDRNDYGEMPSNNTTESVEKSLPYITVPISHNWNSLNGEFLIKNMFEWTGVEKDSEEAKFQHNGNLHLCKKTAEKSEILQGPILIFQLGRFSYRRHSGSDKINTTVVMPEKLTLNDKSYELKSFIQHTGYSIEDGHYISYIKKDSVWYKADDDKITLADDAKITPKEKKDSLEMARNKGYIYSYHLSSAATT